jgi:ABC-type branched-subunit amino acid transport system substrate-binding protein
VLVPLSGGNAAVGRSLANSANLALSDLKGAASGLSIRTYDTAGLGASTAAQRAIAEGATLILGPLLATDVAAVRPVAAAGNVPVLAFSNDAGVAGGNVWVLGYQPQQAVSRVVAYARGRGISTFAGLMPAGTYGQRASVAFTRAVQSSGGQVVALTTFQRDAKRLIAAARTVTAYDARLKRAGAALTRPDGTVAPVSSRVPPVAFRALMIADSGQVAAAFSGPLGQFGASPGTVTLLGTELWNNEPGLARVPAMRGAVFAAVPDSRFQGLAARYRARFGGTPSRLASLAYDAMLLAASARERWPVGSPFPQAVLADPQGFAGIDGIFRFRGNVAERGLEVQRVDGGSFVTVSPAPSAF